MAGPRRRRWFWLGLVMSVVLGHGVPTSAQTDCQSRLARAQALYISGEFTDVEEILEPCVQPGRLSEDNRVWAYRLLALAALQQGHLVEAKLVALSLLTLRPEYQPDPILDPPSYADLIRTVRSQLAVTAPERPTEADTSRILPQPVSSGPIPRITERPPGSIRIEGRPGQVYPVSPLLPYRPSELTSPAQGRRSLPMEVSLWSGDVAFTGDINRNDVLDDYLTHDGPRGGLQVAYSPAPWIAFGLSGEGAWIPKFPVQRRTATQPVRRVEAYIGAGTLDMRLRAWPGSILSPYLSVGASLIVGQVDDSQRVAGGPSAALGLDVAPTRRLSLFAEAAGTMPFPSDAFDDSSERTADLFSGFRAGLRTRIGR